MNTKQNLHTHCTYCDGKDTPEQMIETAIEKGFGSIGFSSHSLTEFSRDFTMDEQNTPLYRQHITRLKKEYEGRIDIFLGIEFDMASEPDSFKYDYRIGTVHNIKKGDNYLSFDRSLDAVIALINDNYDGNGNEFARDYFERLSKLWRVGYFDILGHFDIHTKHIENAPLFDIDSKEYMKWATDAMDCLSGKIPFFEVNTGAISRGYRTTPYPSVPIIKELKARGFLPVITSDCHDRNYLDCYFKEAEQLLKECGFDSRYILTKNGWKGVVL